MTNDTELRARLTRAADTFGAEPLDGFAVRQYAEQHRRRTRGAAAGIAVAVAVAVLAVVTLPRLVRNDVGFTGTPHGATYPQWPLRGDLAGDPAYATAAASVWDTSPETRDHAIHTEVHALYAGRTDVGPVVVLTGLDGQRQRRIAALVGSPSERAFSGRMVVAWDDAAPDPARTRGLVLRLLPNDHTMGPVTALVVAEPGVTRVAVNGRTAFSGAVGWVAGTRFDDLTVTAYRGGMRAFRFHDDGFARWGAQYRDPGSSCGTGAEGEVCTAPTRMVTAGEYDALGWGADPPGERAWAEIGNGDQLLRAWSYRHDGVASGLHVVSGTTLPDGTIVVLAEMGEPERPSIVLAALSGSYVDFYVDEVAGATPVVSAIVDGYLVVFVRDLRARVAHSDGGGTFVDMTNTDGVAVARAPSARFIRVISDRPGQGGGTGVDAIRRLP